MRYFVLEIEGEQMPVAIIKGGKIPDLDKVKVAIQQHFSAQVTNMYVNPKSNMVVFEGTCKAMFSDDDIFDYKLTLTQAEVY